MTRERKARIITLVVLALALVLALMLARARQAGWNLQAWKPADLVRRAAQPGPGPQDAIYAMLDAARIGDVPAYLAGYTGQMAAALRQSLAESGDAGFARYLRDSNAAIKGVALGEPQALTDREVKMRVEYVYQDRNEAQWMYLEKAGAAWKIARVDAVERVKTLVPYGTPVE